MNSEMRVKISESGRVTIPAEFCKALGVEEGDELILRLDEEELRLLTSKQVISEAQAVVRRYAAKNRSLADELIAERREELETRLKSLDSEES